MRSRRLSCLLACVAATAVAFALARIASAGPPLICHPIAIGVDDPALPWGDGPFDEDDRYDRDRVVADTLDRLAPDTPVLARRWVALEAGPRTVTIPSGALCRISAERGPGTPWLEDAPPAFVEALHRFDANDDRAAALDVLLHAVRDRDVLTLFHLIPQTSGPARAQVVGRMIAFAPLPAGVERAAVERLEPAALDAWWSVMGYGWSTGGATEPLRVLQCHRCPRTRRRRNSGRARGSPPLGASS